MADGKKKPYLFKGSDGNEHEIWEADADMAAAKAAEISQRNGIQLQPADPSLFVKPGRQVQTDRQTPDTLQSDPDPSDRNFLLKNLMRFAPSALMGKPGMGAANTGIGMGLDALSGDNHLKAPGAGDFLSELLGAALPLGAGRAEQAASPILKKFGEMAKGSPYLFGAGTGAAAGAASTIGTDSDPTLHATLGAAGSLPGTFLGQRLQSLLKSTPALANPAAEAEATGKLGYRPGDVAGERPDLQQTADTMKTVGQLSDELEKAGAIPALFGSKKRQVTAARTTDTMQAGADAKRARANLRNEKVDARQQRYFDSKRRQEFLDEEAALKVQRAKYQDPNTPGATAIDKKLAQIRAQREIHELAMTGRVGVDSPGVESAKIDLKNKAQRLAALRKINLRNKLGMRDEELDRVALHEVADDVAVSTGFDPRSMDADQKAAVKWLAQDHPEAIVETFLGDEGASVARAKGLLSLFGPKSKEVAAVRNQFVSRMFANSVQDTGRFAGRGLSGEKFGQMLSRIRPEAVNLMFDNSEASKTLRGIEKILVDAELTREPKSLVHFIMSPASVAGSLTRESATGQSRPSAAISLLTAAGIVKAWRSVPAMLDDILEKNSAIGRALRIYAKNPAPGTLARIQAAEVNAGLTEPKPEQTTSAPQ